MISRRLFLRLASADLVLEVLGMFAISDGTQTSYLDVDQNQRATKNMGGSREILFACRSDGLVVGVQSRCRC